MADATHQAALNVQVLDSLVTDYLALRTESPSLVRPTLRGDRLHGRVRSTVDDRLRQERTGNDLCLRYCELIKALLSGDGPGVSKAALDTLSAIPSLDTSALHDPRLQFALRQQEFTELLRKGGPDCELAALRCMREELAPLALNAYPEAYAEFRHLALLLVFQPSHAKSPVADKWAASQRHEVAGRLARTIRQATGAMPTDFELLMRFLILQQRQGSQVLAPDSISQRFSSLMQPSSEAAPLLPLAGCYPVQALDEATVQHLREALWLTRQAAVDSLRHSRGDVEAAVRQELAAYGMDGASLRCLATEYAVYRGLAAEGLPLTAHTSCGKRQAPDAPSTAPPAKQARPNTPSVPDPTPPSFTHHQAPLVPRDHLSAGQPAHASSAAGIPECSTHSQPPAAAPWHDAAMADLPGPSLAEEASQVQCSPDRSCPSSPPSQLSLPSFCSVSPAEHCWTSRSDAAMTEPTEQHPSPCASPKALPKTSSWHAPCKLGTPLREAATQAFSRLQHLLSLPKEPAADASSCAVYDVAGARAIRGQASDELQHSKIARTSADVTKRPASEAPQVPAQAPAAALSAQAKMKRVLDTCQAGRHQEVKEGVKALGMCMGEQCPEVLFELERQACAQSVADRDPMAAVLHCRACLTPLASQHPSFLPALKEVTTSCVTDSQGAWSVEASMAAVRSALQAALAKHLGFPQPRLFLLLTELLQCQAALVKAQRWSGPFQRLLHVDALSKPEPKLPLCSQPSSPLTPAQRPELAKPPGSSSPHSTWQRSGSRHRSQAAAGTAAAASGVLGEHGLVYGDVGDADAEGLPGNGYLGINSAPEEASSSLPGQQAGQGTPNFAALFAGPMTLPSGDPAEDSDSEDADADEDLDAEAAVVRVMEFLNCSRASAVELLDAHHGSSSRVICAVLDGQPVPGRGAA